MDKYTAADENTGTLRGLKIQSLSLWMVAATLIVSILIGNGIVQVMRHHRELADMTQKYVLVQEQAKELFLGSNYLTDQARLYAVTKDYKYA